MPEPWEEIAAQLKASDAWRYAGRCRLCGFVGVWCVDRDVKWNEFARQVLDHCGPRLWVRCENCGVDTYHDTLGLSPHPEEDDET